MSALTPPAIPLTVHRQDYKEEVLQLLPNNLLMSQKVEPKPRIHSVQFSFSVVSDSLRPHGLQHARHPCPSPTPGACSNSCPLSWWWHPTISSSVVPFSSCLHSFPALGSFPVSVLFTSDGQGIGTSASALVLPMSIQG